MTARVHLALLALAIVVLVAGGLVAFLLWRPQIHHSIQVDRQAQVQVAPRARRAVPEVSEKDKSRLADAARRVPLGTVMHWYGQQRFADGNAPGTMSIPSQCLKEAQADPKLAKWLEDWQTNLRNRAPPNPSQAPSTPGQSASAAPGASTADFTSANHSEDAQDDSSDSDSQLSQQTPQRNSTTSQQLKELEQILQASPLKALPLLDIGRAVDFLSDDEVATSRFYAAAGLRGAKEAAGKLSALEYRKLLLGLNSTRPVMWRVIDGGDRQPVTGLKALCDTIAKWQPNSGDKRLDSDSTFAMINSAECLYMQGKYDRAVITLDAVYQRDLTGRQQLAASWASALELFASQRYQNCIPYLQSVSGSGNPHETDATALLAMSLLRVDRLDEAKPLLERLRRQNAPSAYIRQIEMEIGQQDARSQPWTKAK